jgi:hypothetical protein
VCVILSLVLKFVGGSVFNRLRLVICMYHYLLDVEMTLLRRC